MSLSFRSGASHLLFLALLCPIPRSILTSPHLLGSLLPSGLGLLQEDLQQDSERGELKLLLRAQREALATRLLVPLSRGPLGSLHFLERRQGENGGKKNEALTSIAGGLQAVSREKGGFGFRFGRKRWTDWRRENLKWKRAGRVKLGGGAGSSEDLLRSFTPPAHSTDQTKQNVEGQTVTMET